MQSLYANGFENIYDAMYQTFIDYKKEYEFYSGVLNKNKVKQVLEVGAGTGNLAAHFIDSDIGYAGLDFSLDMVKLAQSKNPKGTFLQGDMRNFKLAEPVESIIITGRTSSYLLNNNAIHAALQSIYKNLKQGGLLCFDFIDANRFFKSIKGGKKMYHEAYFNDRCYYRESYMKTNRLDNFMFNWDAVYYEKTASEPIRLTEDKSVVRAFTINEWELFLYLNDFELLEFIDKKTYAFDTYVVVAKKK